MSLFWFDELDIVVELVLLDEKAKEVLEVAADRWGSTKSTIQEDFLEYISTK